MKIYLLQWLDSEENSPYQRFASRRKSDVEKKYKDLIKIQKDENGGITLMQKEKAIERIVIKNVSDLENLINTVIDQK